MSSTMQQLPFAAVRYDQPFWLADRNGAPICHETYHRLPTSPTALANARCCWQDQHGTMRTTNIVLDDATNVFVAHVMPFPAALDPSVATFVAALRADGRVKVEWIVYWYADTSELDSVVFVASDGTIREEEGDDLPCDWQTALYELAGQVGGDEPYGTFEFDVGTGVVRHTGDAWMPDPQLETLPFAPDKVVTRTIWDRTP